MYNIWYGSQSSTKIPTSCERNRRQLIIEIGRGVMREHGDGLYMVRVGGPTAFLVVM